MLDNASQQVLLAIKRSGEAHTGGAMTFDAYGDLWITVGKNAPDYPNSYNETTESRSTESTSSNLADDRGGVLRIHPDNTARGYSIPEGNFGPYWSNYFKNKGNADLAAQYNDTSKVRPELYVKGTRNAYSIAVHPTRRWLAWGEFNINTTNTYTEEHNLVTHPAFGGYPYFTGGFGPGIGTGYYELWSAEAASKYNTAHPGLTQSAEGPVNMSVWNKGPQQLPPVTPALNTYLRNTAAGAVTGPIYAYDSTSPSLIKWPPHFDGAWFVTDWNQGTNNNGFQGAKIYKLNAAGDAKIDSVNWFTKLGWSNPISFDQGPDGAIYIINYSGWYGSTSSTHIGRLEYIGGCKSNSAVFGRMALPYETDFGIDLSTLWVTRKGPWNLSIRNAAGSLIFEAHQQGPAHFALGDKLNQTSLYLITLESIDKKATFKWARPF
jgi:cytochrome c